MIRQHIFLILSINVSKGNFDLGTIFCTPKNHENQSAVHPKSKYGEKKIDFKQLKALYWHLLILAVVVSRRFKSFVAWFASWCLCWWTCNVKDFSFSHWSHANAFSAVCVNWWTLSECLVVEYLGHLSHGNNFPVSFSITLLGYMGSLATWQRTMWSFKYALSLKDLSHRLQRYGLSSVSFCA